MQSINENTYDVVKFARLFLRLILFFSILGEIIFFPSLANCCGCMMNVVVWFIFDTFFLRKEIIIEHLFPFLSYSFMFMNIFMPLPATLIEWKPITYGLQIPFKTFFFETFLFIIASLAFYIVINSRHTKFAFLHNKLVRYGFFDLDETVIWGMGIVGLSSQIYYILVLNGESQYGDVMNKFIHGLFFLRCAPIILLFPNLIGLYNLRTKMKSVIIYLLLCSAISLFANSRSVLLTPIMISFMLLIINCIKKQVNILKYFSLVKLIFYCILVVFFIHFVSNISLAMLHVRVMKQSVSRYELFVKTLETLTNEEEMTKLRLLNEEKTAKLSPYVYGWTEEYCENFLLNRFANLRIADETLYYADKIGYSNKKMRSFLIDKTIAILPNPILVFLYIDLDKKQMEYSPGDMLYLLGSGIESFGGHRVTRLVGDGLATFGYWFFPIIFFIFILIFKLLNTLELCSCDRIVYSGFGLMYIITIFATFFDRGCADMCGFLLRGFWQPLILFFVVMFFLKFLFLKKD
jgi:hypothetical protein